MTCRVVIFKATGYGYGKSCFINALYSQKAHAVFFIKQYSLLNSLYKLIK